MAKEPVLQESFHFIAVEDTLNNSRNMYIKESKRKGVINMGGPDVRDVASYGCKNSGKVSAIKKSVVISQNEDCDTITRESEREEKINKRRRICVPTVTTYRLK
jgi:benzoyl-CoA reductase/2-hydroxyglutaryl-CoA dehydratase subunit BcrC/BadD/HgdB